MFKRELATLNQMDTIVKELDEFHSVELKLIDTIAAIDRLAEDVEYLEEVVYQFDTEWRDFNRKVESNF